MTDAEPSSRPISGLDINTMEIDDSNDGEEILLEDIPPLSSYMTGCKFWCNFALGPLIFVSLNVLALVSWLKFDKHEFKFSEVQYYGLTRSDVILDMFKVNSLVAACILLVDAFVLITASRFLEQQISNFNTREGSENSSDGNIDVEHIHAKVSLKFDRYLGHTRRASRGSPILLGLVYVITILCCAACLASVGVCLFAQSSGAQAYCTYKARKKERIDVADIAGIPQDLQYWAKSARQNIDKAGGWALNVQSMSYTHMTDGRTFFAGDSIIKRSNTKDVSDNTEETDDETERMHFGATKLLLYIGDDRKLHYSYDIAIPHMFTSLLGSSVEDSELFCCVYFEKYRAQSVLCVAEGEDVSHGFRNTSLVPQSNFNRFLHSGYITTGHGGNLWIATLWENDLVRNWEYEYEARERILAFSKLDPGSMKLQSVANITQQYMYNDRVIEELGLGGKCMLWFSAISFASIMTVVLPSCYWLIRIKRMEIGVVPLTLATCFILMSINLKIVRTLGLPVTCATSLLLLLRWLPKWLDREVLICFHYSVITFFLLFFYGDSASAYVVVIGCVTGVILNHPILEVLGWVVSTIFPLIGFLEISSGRSLFFGGFGPLVIPYWIIVGCGLIVTGRALRKYRAYIKYYSRNLWVALRTTEIASRRSGNQRSDCENLTSRLID